MEPPKSTVDNSLQWRLWHGLNYMTGGIGFIIGSALLFPHLNRYLPATVISAWLYTIGSFTFIVADYTQWLHYTYSDCRYLQLAINFFVSIVGSGLYLIGSALFLPQFNQPDLGVDYFIYGSSFVMVSQSWKLFRTFNQSGKGMKAIFNEDPSGILIDLFAGLGGLCYFTGSFFFQKTAIHPNLAYPAASFYTLGGLNFCISGFFMQKRYFCQHPQEENQLLTNDV